MLHADTDQADDEGKELPACLLTPWQNAKGAALSTLRRYEEALQAFERALQVEPNNTASWNGKGATLNDCLE